MAKFLDYTGLTSVITKIKALLGYKEDTSNKVTSISSSSTNTQYPSAKLLYDQLALKQGALTPGTNIQINNGTISATDTKYTAGTNISIDGSNKISATDTTYSAFVGTNGSTAGSAGLVPGPAASDSGKYLKADGTWSLIDTGVDDYEDLANKPSINNVTLIGNKTTSDLGIAVPVITYSTTDITAGVTQLADGDLYFVYE